MENSLIHIGIDIGQKGGIFIKSPLFRKYMSMPVKEDGHLDMLKLVSILNDFSTEFTKVYFEYLTPLHLASKKNNWSLAIQSGAVEMACVSLGLKYFKIPPKEWQATMCKDIAPIRKEGGSIDTKERALLAVQKLYPEEKFLDPAKPKSVKPHDGIIDAVLICEYGEKYYTNKGNQND